MLGDIYGKLRFRVVDGAERSEQHQQLAGISQGFPLSLFLFVMVMSVLVSDAVALLGDNEKKAFEERVLATILNADDTLLIGESADGVLRFLEAVAETGAKYGMELHWKQIPASANALPFRCTGTVRRSYNKERFHTIRGCSFMGRRFFE